VVLTIGDGAFAYNPVIPSYDASNAYELPLLIVVFNNRVYKSMNLNHRRFYPEGAAAETGEWLGTDLHRLPRLAAFAEPFGMHTETVDAPRPSPPRWSVRSRPWPRAPPPSSTSSSPAEPGRHPPPCPTPQRPSRARSLSRRRPAHLLRRPPGEGRPERRARRTTADVFVWAALRGVDSHGIARVPAYLELLAKGVANADADITIESTTPAAAVLDADRAPGPVALSAAADEAVTRARISGIAAVGVRRHRPHRRHRLLRVEDRRTGPGRHRLRRRHAQHGLHRRQGRRRGDQPARHRRTHRPSRGTPRCCSTWPPPPSPSGKIRQAKASGTPLPEGAAATADGTPTTDPELAVMPLPLGGAKGSGMSLAFELLTSVLVGAPIFSAFHSDDPKGRKHRQNALLIALDPAAFGDPAAFTAASTKRWPPSSRLPPADGAEGVFYPGERSAAVAGSGPCEGHPRGAQGVARTDRAASAWLMSRVAG
jgi:ureidoglycolate dehydrogenase (NAD+)